jgi:type I restriction enzyme S subunit
VPSISRPATNLKAIQFCLPFKPVVDAFHGVVHSLHAKIGANRHENFTLAQLRDLLLPKLMSGEIHLQEAEKLAGEQV